MKMVGGNGSGGSGKVLYIIKPPHDPVSLVVKLSNTNQFNHL